jgi:hypothetical protein
LQSAQKHHTVRNQVLYRYGHGMRIVPHVDPHSQRNRFRSERFRIFKEITDQVIAEKQSCRVLDVGGTPSYWQTFGGELAWDRLSVSVLNLSLSPVNHPGILSLTGDARNMKEFDDFSFDVVHSNSVLEHVGRWGDMASMAHEIRRIAPRYFVQTPYFWFPIEPHAQFPLLHWMPESWRYRIIMRRTCGYWQRQSDLGLAMKAIQGAVLIDKRQMKYLFPDAKILSERIFGLTKSLMAIR